MKRYASNAIALASLGLVILSVTSAVSAGRGDRGTGVVRLSGAELQEVRGWTTCTWQWFRAINQCGSGTPVGGCTGDPTIGCGTCLSDCSATFVGYDNNSAGGFFKGYLGSVVCGNSAPFGMLTTFTRKNCNMVAGTPNTCQCTGAVIGLPMPCNIRNLDRYYPC